MEECQEKSRKKTTVKEGKWRNDRKKVGKKRRKVVENRGKMEDARKKVGQEQQKMKANRPKQVENGGKWRNSEAQRSAAFVGVRNKRVCKGMRSDTEERLQLQMVWASV